MAAAGGGFLSSSLLSYRAWLSVVDDEERCKVSKACWPSQRKAPGLFIPLEADLRPWVIWGLSA